MARLRYFAKDALIILDLWVLQRAYYARLRVLFEGNAFLGAWNMESKQFPPFTPFNRLLWNEIFNSFREKHGYGKDFTVLSPLYRVPDFKGKCWNVK